IALAVVLLAGAALKAILGHGPSLLAAPPPDAAALGRVAVLPFAIQGAMTPGDSLGRAMVELLGSRLDGAGALRTVPADSVLGAADRSGAALGAPVGSVIEG